MHIDKDSQYITKVPSVGHTERSPPVPPSRPRTTFKVFISHTSIAITTIAKMSKIVDLILHDACLTAHNESTKAAALEALQQVLENGRYEYEDGDKNLSEKEKKDLTEEIELRLRS